MTRIMKPRAVAVIGASNEAGKIGNSVMKNLVNGGYRGEIYPINPKADEILGLKAFPSIADVPGDVDVAVFAIPAKFVAARSSRAAQKGVAGAILIPSGFAETGEQELQDEVVAIARKHGVRILGPEHLRLLLHAGEPLRDVLHAVRRQGQCRAVVAERRHRDGDPRLQPVHRMGVSAIVGVGNKADIDEDDLLTFFEHDDNTQLSRHAPGGPQGRPGVRRDGAAGVEEEAGRRAQGRPHRPGRPGRELAHRRAGRQRQGLRRHPAAERRGPGAGAERDAPSTPAASRCCRRRRARTS